MTDNRNRTGGDIRHYFDKFGGNLGQTGCVSYLFTDKGTIIVENDGKVSEDEVMDSALEAGAEDFDATDEAFEITTAPEDLDAVTAALTEKGYKILSSEQEKIPSMYVTLTDEEQLRKMNLLIEKLEENDDVTDFWHNLENEE